ncbi:MAG: EAL domain-containing protein [Oscillospiraceae bacterium]|nr:EAL domain-containing protein [Oscillospiraceae bacterium]
MEQERLYQPWKKQTAICSLLLIALMLLFSASLPVRASGGEVIRVGYDSNSNFIQEKDGHFYGYGVEYLEKISEYTGWQYEYVRDASWHDSLKKLRNGDIDLICTAHYTDTRAEEFLYSRIPLGYETTILYTTEKSDISYQNYDAMQGSTVGLLAESYSAADFIRYAEEEQISYEGIYFNREDDMIRALEMEQIDMMVVGSRYATSELKLVDTSSADAFYCIVQPGNHALVEAVDEAIQEIMFDDPTFEGNLNAKYFGHESISSSPLYTEEELAYIENLGTIKVKLFQDQHPSCYVEDGETKGIWADVIRLIAKKSGIDLVPEGGDLERYSQEAFKQYLNEGYLLLRTQNALQHMSDIENTIVSNSIANVSVSYVKRQAAFVEDKYVSHIIATTKDLAYLEPMLLEENPEFEMQYFPDAKACFEALIHKEAGMVIQNSYRARYLMQKPEYMDKLTVVPGVDHGNDVCLMALEDQQMLLHIINKAIHHISDEEINEIVTRELLMTPYPLGNEDFIYQNWEWLLVIAALLVFSFISYALVTNKLANAKIQKKELELLQKKIQQDEITGLYNRSHFYELAQERILNSEEEMYIVSVDISNFKIVNELYGMHVGDRLLKEIGSELKKLDKNHTMILARFMIDHFYMCVSKSEFEQIVFPKSFHTFLEDIDVRVIYGVFPVLNKEQPIHVMCDRALEAAHDKDRTYREYLRFYNDSGRQRALMEKEIEADMEQALAERQFFVVIQPKFNPHSERVVGGEALVRWNHHKKGLISPGVFIHIFERNGFITTLDHFVWEETCRLQAEMKQNGIKTVPIAINISRFHFYSSDLRSKLNELIRTYGLSPSDIELEITESVCGEESGSVNDIIRKLQLDGFKIAMDDFGSGYSSLNMLKDMPLDVLKMDLKFLDGEGQKSRFILKSLIEMAHIMDLAVVVEGVELPSQVEFLRQFDNCSLQGYYYSRPLAPSAFAALLKVNET